MHFFNFPLEVPLPRHRISCGVTLALLCGLMSAAPSAFAQETGRAGVPDSWRSAEFNRDWGLAAINAHYAYA
ncbi:MAG TPA: hypothetical protein VIP30_12710, partial [Stenotrophomonas sp.]